jgi:hypothetical protein
MLGDKHPAYLMNVPMDGLQQHAKNKPQFVPFHINRMNFFSGINGLKPLEY